MSRKMSLLDQPDEIIIEQLRYLPLRDLLSLCSTNSQISRICSGRQLWYFRLIDDFKVADPTRITDTRGYYFSLLQDRKDILNFIISKITQQFFNTHNFFGEFDINTYQEFMDIQRTTVNQLTEQGIIDAKTIRRLLPQLESADFSTESAFWPNAFFYELYRGNYKIVLTSV